MFVHQSLIFDFHFEFIGAKNDLSSLVKDAAMYEAEIRMYFGLLAIVRACHPLAFYRFQISHHSLFVVSPMASNLQNLDL